MCVVVCKVCRPYARGTSFGNSLSESFDVESILVNHSVYTHVRKTHTNTQTQTHTHTHTNTHTTYTHKRTHTHSNHPNNHPNKQTHTTTPQPQRINQRTHTHIHIHMDIHAAHTFQLERVQKDLEGVTTCVYVALLHDTAYTES